MKSHYVTQLAALNGPKAAFTEWSINKVQCVAYLPPEPALRQAVSGAEQCGWRPTEKSFAILRDQANLPQQNCL